MGLTDIFKGKQYKQELENLQKEHLALQDSYQDLQNLKLSMEKMTALELQDTISTLKNEKNSLKLEISESRKIIDQLKSDRDKIQTEIENKSKQIYDLDMDLYVQDFGLYSPKYNFSTALGYKDRLDEIRNEQKELIKSNKAANFSTNWTVDGSKSKGAKMVKDTIKMMLRAYNGECDTLISKVNYNNIDSIKKRIQKSADDINKMNQTTLTSISNKYIDLKKQELHLAYEYEQKKQLEKELLKEQREKEREEKALQKEVESQKKRIDKEIAHMNNVMEELRLKLLSVKTEDEKKEIEKTLEELRTNIDIYEDQKKELDYRIENIGAGYVYVISNIGAFGKDVYKIGVTRRLDPLERIHELSSASVPFKFDVHALIFSYKAYELEAHLHNVFDKNRVNKVNNRKEFFRISIEDIEKELNNYKDLTVEFMKEAEAQEYRESLKFSC